MINASKKGVGGIGEAIRSAAPWPCARRERRGKSPLSLQDLPGPKDLLLTATPSAVDLPRPGGICCPFLLHRFSNLMFEVVFVSLWVPFEAPNRRKCPHAMIQNRPSKNVFPNFGFGSFFVDARRPWNLENELLA